MTAGDLDALAEMFREFAVHEFAGHSAVYAALAHACADEPRLGRALLAAPPPQRRALLLFAAAQYLLRTSAAGHPLAAYLPVLGGTRPADEHLVAAYAELVERHQDELSHICATRTTQTNEPARAALLWPAFAFGAALFGAGSLDLIELGTSAGLLLLPDRYAYSYVDSRGHRRDAGRADAPDELRFECELRDSEAPQLQADGPAIRSRTGIDLHPIDAADSDAVSWLRSCIWPEQTARLARLDAALAEAARVRPRLVRGDILATLPTVLSTVEGLATVVTSHALTYLTADARTQLVQQLHDYGREHELLAVLNETVRHGADLFARVPAATGPQAALTVVAWRAGQATVVVAGRTGPHGSWLSWNPREYAYQPRLPG